MMEKNEQDYFVRFRQLAVTRPTYLSKEKPAGGEDRNYDLFYYNEDNTAQILGRIVYDPREEGCYFYTMGEDFFSKRLPYKEQFIKWNMEIIRNMKHYDED